MYPTARQQNLGVWRLGGVFTSDECTKCSADMLDSSSLLEWLLFRCMSDLTLVCQAPVRSVGPAGSSSLHLCHQPRGERGATGLMTSALRDTATARGNESICRIRNQSHKSVFSALVINKLCFTLGAWMLVNHRPSLCQSIIALPSMFINCGLVELQQMAP